MESESWVVQAQQPIGMNQGIERAQWRDANDTVTARHGLWAYKPTRLPRQQL